MKYAIVTVDHALGSDAPPRHTVIRGRDKQGFEIGEATSLAQLCRDLFTHQLSIRGCDIYRSVRFVPL